METRIRCLLIAVIVTILGIKLKMVHAIADDLQYECQNRFKEVNNVEYMLELINELRTGIDKWTPEEISARGLWRCILQFDSIDELGRLLDYSGDMCHPNHVDNIIEYYRRYVEITPQEAHQDPNYRYKRIVRKFARRYGLFVALQCRLNAPINLLQMSAEYSAQDWAKVLSWYAKFKEAETEKVRATKSSTRTFETTTFAEGPCEIIDDFIEQMPSDINTMSSEHQTSMSEFELKMYDSEGLEVPNDENLKDVIEVCDKFARYYQGQLLSIVRLDRIGYRWTSGTVGELANANVDDRGRFRDMLKVAQICFVLRKLKYKVSIITNEKDQVDYYTFGNNEREKNVKFPNVWMIEHASNTIDLQEECVNKLVKVDSIDRMMMIVEKLRHQRQQWARQDNWQGVVSGSPINDEAEGNLKRCMDEFDSIDELGQLLTYARDICHPNHVENILSYHRKFLLASESNGFRVNHLFAKNKKMVRHFFRRYTSHVAHICRHNLVTNLRSISGQFSAHEWNQVLVWRSLPGWQSQSKNSTDEVASELREAVRNYVNQIESIDSIDELTSLLPIGTVAITSGPETMLSPDERRLYIQLQVHFDDTMNSYEPRAQIELCDKFARYYEGQLLSIVRLANAGYQLDDQKLENELDEVSPDDRRLVSDWLKVALVCYSVRKLKNSSSNQFYHDFMSNHLKARSTYEPLPKYNDQDTKSVWSSRLASSASRTTNRLVGATARILGLSRLNERPNGVQKLRQYLEINPVDRPVRCGQHKCNDSNSDTPTLKDSHLLIAGVVPLICLL